MKIKRNKQLNLLVLKTKLNRNHTTHVNRKQITKEVLKKKSKLLFLVKINMDNAIFHLN